MEIFIHATEYVILEFNIMYEISKTHICRMLYIYLFSIYNLFNDIFIASECVAFDGSVVSK
jgi:hypothetical protein